MEIIYNNSQDKIKIPDVVKKDINALKIFFKACNHIDANIILFNTFMKKIEVTYKAYHENFSITLYERYEDNDRLLAIWKVKYSIF